YLREHRTVRDFHHAHNVLETLDQRPENSDRRCVRVGLLTSYTTDFVVPLLKAEMALTDIRCDIYKPGFNQFRQVLLNPASGLYGFRPDVTIVGFGIEDIFPDDVSRFALLSDADRNDLRQQLLDMCESLVRT